MKILAFLIVATGCASNTAGGRSQQPLPLDAVPDNQLIRWPSIAFIGDTTFVAANLFPVRGDSLDRSPTYLGRRLEQHGQTPRSLPPMPLPPGAFQIAYPRLIAIGETLHMV